MWLLRAMRAALFPLRETEGRVSETTDNALFAAMSPVTIPHETEHLVALLPYKHPLVSALIIEAKYHGNQKAFTLLGSVLAEYLASFVAEEDAYESRAFHLVPIPLGALRQKERGYNQVERIVTATLSVLHIPGKPSSHVLERIRETESQTHLTRDARLENVHGAFLGKHVDPDAVYILIDDVVTTGATFAAAAEALRKAGASRVVSVALAH
jgi:ComF family protein